MVRLIKSVAKAAGPKLLVGAALSAVAFLVSSYVDRGRDLRSAGPTAAAPKAAPDDRPAERSRANPLPIDPHALVVRSVLPITQPFRHGDYAWDESRAPAAGPVIVTVDLKAQTLSVFRAGHEIGAAVIIYGADDKPSPLGAFPVTQKDADHVSTLYDAPMPYMLRLTNDGVAIHGSDVKWGNATHGCIGVPTAFARKLFGVVKLGDLVIITNGKMLDLSRAERS
jgi:lipoprotein-anchoring transpeptidase ErfK/SrfK